jgi:hypothetical protein
VEAILEIDEASASSLVDSADVAQLLRKLAAMPFGIRSALVDGIFLSIRLTMCVLISGP